MNNLKKIFCMTLWVIQLKIKQQQHKVVKQEDLSTFVKL